MYEIFCGIFTLYNLEHLLNNPFSKLFKLLERVTSVKAVQFENAYPPISVTESGIVIFVKAVQSENAYSPILVAF